MPRNRTIYQTEAVYAGKSPATGIQFASNTTPPTVNATQISRVQSANYGYTIPRKDVNQFGELAAIDRVQLESPTVNLDITYLNQSFLNEANLGFYVTSGNAAELSCITNILNKTEDERNYWIKTVTEGNDAVLNTETATPVFIGIGNGFISNFSTEGSVGDFPRTSVSIEGLNFSIDRAVGTASGLFPGFVPTGTVMVFNPAVNPTDGTKLADTALIANNSTSSGQKYAAITRYFSNHFNVSAGAYALSVLRPGDITFDFFTAGSTTAQQDLGATISDAKIQSYSLSFGLSREPLQKLGSKFAFAREIQFPVTINMRIDANVGDLTTGNLADLLRTDASYDCRVKIAHPLTGSLLQMMYTLKNAKLDSQSYSSSIGPSKSVTLNFSSQIGGPLQTTKGLFFSGITAQTA